MRTHRTVVLSLLAGAALAVAVMAVAALVGVYAGAYNVAAREPHGDIVRWAFDTTMHRSVSGRAEAVAEPAQARLMVAPKSKGMPPPGPARGGRSSGGSASAPSGAS